jgi:hypothetical protein
VDPGVGPSQEVAEQYQPRPRRSPVGSRRQPDCHDRAECLPLALLQACPSPPNSHGRTNPSLIRRAGVRTSRLAGFQNDIGLVRHSTHGDLYLRHHLARHPAEGRSASPAAPGGPLRWPERARRWKSERVSRYTLTTVQPGFSWGRVTIALRAGRGVWSCPDLGETSRTLPAQ